MRASFFTIVGVLALFLLLGCSTQRGQFAVSPPHRFNQVQAAAKDRDLLTSEWRSGAGEVLMLLQWPRGPQFDRGPLVVLSEEPMSVAGQSTRLIHTQVFF